MPFLSDRDKNRLKEIFEENLEDTVTLIMFTQDFECLYCRETRILLEEVSRLHPLLNLEVYDFQRDEKVAEKYGVDKIPATILIGDRDYGIRFYGIPAGFEFTTLIESILDVSRRKSRLKPETTAKLSSLENDVHIQVFVTPTCPYCPGMARLAYQTALESDKVKADVVEITEFPHLAYRYSVMSVPKTVLNDSIEFVGATSEDSFIEKVVKASLKPSHLV